MDRVRPHSLDYSRVTAITSRLESHRLESPNLQVNSATRSATAQEEVVVDFVNRISVEILSEIFVMLLEAYRESKTSDGDPIQLSISFHHCSSL